MANSILLEVVNNALRSVAEQMTVTMVRSSYSTIVKEMARYGCNLADFIPREIIDEVNQRMHELEGKEG